MVVSAGYRLNTTAEAESNTPPLTNTLSRSEVIERFRSRATPTEIQQFEHLTTAGDSISETRALELVLFKLKTDELSQIGIAQTESAGHTYWFLASSTHFADGGRAFEQALARVGVSPGGTMDLGKVGWTVPREQFFAARRALLSAGLSAKEITIAEPRFTLR